MLIMMRNGLFYVLLLITCVGAAACNLASSAPVVSPTVAATMPHVRIVQLDSTPFAESTRELRPIPTSTSEPTQTPEPAPATLYECEASDRDHAADYQLVATINYAEKQIDVAQVTRYRNDTSAALEEIVMVVEPNNQPGIFDLQMVQVQGQATEASPVANRLEIPLAEALGPGCELRIDLSFTLRPPRITSGITALKGYFGYSERQLNLAMWLPIVAVHHSGGWIVHQSQSIGEQNLLEQANWDVTLRLAEADSGVVVAAPGQVEEMGPGHWRYRFNDAREFPLSLSESYRVLRQTSPGGIDVEVYAFGDAIIQTNNGQLDGARHVLLETLQAADQFASLFGSYPYQRMLVVQGDFPDGMEFSGLVFVSTAWFYGFDGGADNYLTVITIHEIAHQWWYARVGNDAALAPWLDEALATYSEYIYFEEYHPDLRNWWWSFRVGWYSPSGNVDSTVYEFGSVREYINAVYLRGVQMLHNLREDIGTEAFFTLLENYAQAGSGRIADAALFWSLLPPEQYEITQGTRQDFLREPNVLPSDLRPDPTELP